MPSSNRRTISTSLLAVGLGLALSAHAAETAPPSRAQLKNEASVLVDKRAKLVQEMVDSVFSFAEPGFQEFKTSEYLTGILKSNGFTITTGVAGIPTAWTATWGSEGPLIAIGSDIDALLGLSQMPGTYEVKPMIAGAPGHGEGHNSGMPVMIAAALSTKEVMQKHGIKGRIMVWPGVAEELLATKAFYVRDGVFKNVDATIFCHVANDLSTGWGPAGTTGLVSVEYTFHGRSAHAGAAPWNGRSALDGVELMDIAWNMRREHLPLTQRSHYVITNGGGQPNVVPDVASVWYYFRERDFASIRNLFSLGNTIAEAAAMATETKVTRRLQGYAAPNYANKPIAEAAYENMKVVGMPKWSDADQAFAKAVQEANITAFLHKDAEPLASEVAPLVTPEIARERAIGGSDDIGDIMWTVPTIVVRFPSNIPNTIGHHVTAAMAMATPIAHKGAVTGAKVVAMTVLDLMTDPALLASARDYFNNVQLKDAKYDPVLTAEDKPAIHLNKELMDRLRPQMSRYYYNPKKYPTYLEQLGIQYPNLPPVAQ